jgi:sodium-dependent phosphate cotransporter
MIKAEDKKEISINSKSLWKRSLKLFTIIFSLFIFLFAIQLMSGSLAVIGKDFAKEIVYATSNPFIGLFIGLLATAILQSSSTTTSMTVAAVAVGAISLQGAIPIIMGANLGTTITSTIVSLSFVTKSKEFEKAFAAGTVHDFFNIFIIVILFPLEYYYGLLSSVSSYISSLIQTESSSSIGSQLFINNLFDGAQRFLISTIGVATTLIIAVILIIGIVKIISNLLYDQMIGNSRIRFKSIIFNTRLRSFGWGFLFTSIIQSSSLTSSLIVPLVATNKIHLTRAFQFVLGANLGTTITAIIAALFKSEAAVSLAIAHFMFNFIGVSLFVFIPFLSKLPTYFATSLAKLAVKYRWTAFVYILVVFFLLPFTLIYFSNRQELTYSKPINREIMAKTTADQTIY